MKTLRLCFPVLLIALIVSCKVQFVPSADAAIKAAVVASAQHTDALYLQMINAEDKEFTTYAADYAAVESEINAIAIQDGVRKGGSVVSQQVALLQKNFLQYKSHHREVGTLNSGQLQTYRGLLAGLWLPIIKVESYYK